MKAVNKLGWILFLTGFGAIVFGAAGLIGEEVAAAQLWGVFTPTPTYAALLAGHSRGLQYASVHDDPLVVHFGEIVNQVLGGAARAGGWEGKLAVAEAYRDDRWFEAALELAEDEPTVVLRYAILEATRYMSRASSASDEEREEPRQHALALLARAEELEPDNSLIWYMRSSIRFKRDTDAALAEWREGLTKSDFHTHGAEVTKALQKLFERCHVPDGRDNCFRTLDAGTPLWRYALGYWLMRTPSCLRQWRPALGYFLLRTSFCVREGRKRRHLFLIPSATSASSCSRLPNCLRLRPHGG